MAKTAAQRMREFRARIKASSQPENEKKIMLQAYRLGYADALAGKKPNPPAGVNAAISYIAGGLDVE